MVAALLRCQSVARQKSSFSRCGDGGAAATALPAKGEGPLRRAMFPKS